MLLYALDPTDSGRKVGAQKPAVGSLVCKPANGGEAQVDSGGGILGLFETDPVACHYLLVEGKARFRAVPVDEFANGMIVRSLRTPGGQAIQDRRFGMFEIGQFQNGFRIASAFVFGHSRSLHDLESSGWF
jgi:hypothetical protein